MTNIKLTEVQMEALRHLVTLRHCASRLLRAQKANRAVIRLLNAAQAQFLKNGDAEAEAQCTIDLIEAKDAAIEFSFKVIEVGLEFMDSCSEYDKLPREVWLRALSVNESEWESPLMLEYGNCVRNVVAVLNMENSATSRGDDYDIVHKPLNWCCSMAMMNASQTNPAFGKAMHDISNEALNGAFGEWKAPTMLERIGVRT